MYFALILKHLKLSLDVLALKIYIHILMTIQNRSTKLAEYLLHLGTISGDKATIVLEQYHHAGTKEITFRYKVRWLTAPDHEPRFQINKF